MTDRRMATAWVGVFAVALVAGGCGETRVNVMAGARPDASYRIAVLDFNSSTEPVETLLGARDVHQIDKAGEIVADAVSVALVDVPQLHVVESRRLKQVMADLKLTPADALTPANLKKLGEAAEIDGVVVGYVSDFHWWQVVFCSGSDLAFTARLVSTQTGEVLWSAAIHRSRYHNHSEVLFDACAALADKLANKLE